MIAFDAMGVIFIDGDDVKSCLIPFLRERGVLEADDEIVARYRAASLGKTGAREFWSYFGLSDGYAAVQESYLRKRVRLDPGFAAAAGELSAWADIGLLSNDLGEWSAELRSIHSIEGLFSLAVVSGDVGLRKPDPAIYRLFVERARRPAQEVLFIDDRPDNLRAASGVGMRTLLFRRDGRPASVPGPACADGFSPDAAASDLRDVPALARRALSALPSP